MAAIKIGEWARTGFKRPEMILFDFGGTLMTEVAEFEKGHAAVLKAAVKVPEGVTVEKIRELERDVFHEIYTCPSCGGEGRFEAHFAHINKYLYEYFGLEFDRSYAELEEIFCKGAYIVTKSTPNVERLLEALHGAGIRTAVISNILYSGELLERWIRGLLPDHHFDFIIASGEYAFRKPSTRLFELALRKAGLKAENAWYIGNNARCDVIGAKAAGITPMGYKGDFWENSSGEPDFDYAEIYDWDELSELFL